MDLVTLSLAKNYTDKQVENISVSGGVLIDDTLTKSKAAADARVVGDALKEKADRKNAIYYVEGTEDSTVSDLKGINPEITELYEGLTIAYKMPIDFTPGPPVLLQINNLQNKQIYNVGTTYNFGSVSKGSIIIFVYTETNGLYYWHADWDKPQAQFGVNTSSEKRYLTATANLGGGTTSLYTNGNCYMKDGTLYSDNEKVGKHKNSIIFIKGDSKQSGYWTGTSSEITEYFEGLTIAYQTNTPGNSGPPTYLNINNLGNLLIRKNNNSYIYQEYAVGSVLILTYTTQSTGLGQWQMVDSDYKVGALSNPNKKLYLVGATNATSSGSGTTGYTNTNCYIGADNHLYSNNSRVPTYETGTITLTSEAFTDDVVLKGDFFRIDDMVTINFFVSGTPKITKPADSDLLDDANRKIAEIKFSGLPYPPVDDGRNWYAGGGHLQGYYPLYNQGGVATQTTFTGWTMNMEGSIFARTVTQGGYAGYALAVDQGTGVKVYGAGTLTYRAQLPAETALIDDLDIESTEEG